MLTLGTVQAQGPYLCTLDPLPLLGLSRKEEHKSGPSTCLSTTKYNLPFKQKSSASSASRTRQEAMVGRHGFRQLRDAEEGNAGAVDLIEHARGVCGAI